MARPEATDFLTNFRFHVTSIKTGDGGKNYIKFDDGIGAGGEAGFQTVSLPEITIPAADYREGTSKYTKKFPGPPEISELSMARGVTTKDTNFFNWAIAAISGGEYRSDLLISQFIRSILPEPGPEDFAATPDAAKTRQYKCFECIPVRVKPASDLDASSGEVSLAEVDVAIEYFTITLPAGA